MLGLFGVSQKSSASKLVHRRRTELVLDALEMIEALDGAVEFRAFLVGKLGFHLTVRIPGRIAATTGACPASTPKSPSAPGTST